MSCTLDALGLRRVVIRCHGATGGLHSSARATAATAYATTGTADPTDHRHPGPSGSQPAADRRRGARALHREQPDRVQRSARIGPDAFGRGRSELDGGSPDGGRWRAGGSLEPWRRRPPYSERQLECRGHAAGAFGAAREPGQPASVDDAVQQRDSGSRRPVGALHGLADDRSLLRLRPGARLLRAGGEGRLGLLPPGRRELARRMARSARATALRSGRVPSDARGELRGGAHHLRRRCRGNPPWGCRPHPR